MKRIISYLLCAVILLSCAAVTPFAFAEESGEEEKIELNTLYEAAFDKDDKLLDKKEKTYFDYYSFKVEYDGKVTLTVKSDTKGYLSKYVQYMILDEKSDKVWSPDNTKFKGKWSITLKKGSYAFVPVYTKTTAKEGKMLGGTYNFKLAYKPNIKTPKLVSLKPKKKGFKAEWKKVKGVTGYQLEYSTKKNFSKSEKIKIEGAKTIEAAVTELKAKKKYYVRVRAYKTFKFGDKKKTYYSKWSEVKTIKTK